MRAQNLFLLILIGLLNACLPEKHLEFENIQINGNINDFAGELIKLGFTESPSGQENQIKLKGLFLERNCEVYVYGTIKSQTAYQVTVNMPGEVRDSLENSFWKIQKLYTSRYGRGTSRYQQFKNSSRFLFNETKRNMRISMGDFTRYPTDSGTITMEVREGYISVTYLDKLNNEIRERELEEEKKQK